MKGLGLFLLILGGLFLLFSVLPDGLLISMDFAPNLMRFVNNYTGIMAIFLLSGGAGAFYIGTKYPSRLMKTHSHPHSH